MNIKKYEIVCKVCGINRPKSSVIFHELEATICDNCLKIMGEDIIIRTVFDRFKPLQTILNTKIGEAITEIRRVTFDEKRAINPELN